MVSLSPCGKQIHQVIAKYLQTKTKSLLFSDAKKLIYHGETIVSKDRKLKKQCEAISRGKGFLYLKGGLTRSLYKFLAPFAGLHVVLDNFTLYLNITTSLQQGIEFKPHLVLFHPVAIKTIFIKQETNFDLSLLPPGVVARNLFREIHYEG